MAAGIQTLTLGSVVRGAGIMKRAGLSSVHAAMKTIAVISQKGGAGPDVPDVRPVVLLVFEQYDWAKADLISDVRSS